MTGLKEMRAPTSDVPWILAWWSKWFHLRVWNFLPVNLLIWIRGKVAPQSPREKVERFIEKSVFSFWLVPVVIFLVLTTGQAVFGELPGWLLVAETIVAVIGLLRCWETFIVQTKVLIFDPYWKAKDGYLHSLRGYYRLLILLVHNYVEAIFWFALAYRSADGWFNSFGGSVYSGSLKSLYLSIFSLTSFGETAAQGIQVKNFGGSILVLGESAFGLFMALLILSRFISILPTSWTEDQNERNLVVEFERVTGTSDPGSTQGLSGVKKASAAEASVNAASHNNDDRTQVENARAEYAAIGQLVAPTSIIRFATLTAFFTFNGVLLSRAVGSSRNDLVILAIIGVVGDLLLILLESRTIDGHQTLMKRGRELEKDALSIANGTYTRQQERTGWPWGHGRVLICSYILTLVGWMLVIAYCMGWLHGSLAAIGGS